MERDDPWFQETPEREDDITLVRTEFKKRYAALFLEIYSWLSPEGEKGAVAQTFLNIVHTFIIAYRQNRLLRKTTATEAFRKSMSYAARMNGYLAELRRLQDKLVDVKNDEGFQDMRKVLIEHVAIYSRHGDDIHEDDRALLVDTVIDSVISKYSVLISKAIFDLQKKHSILMEVHSGLMDRMVHQARGMGSSIMSCLSQEKESDDSDVTVGETLVGEWLM